MTNKTMGEQIAELRREAGMTQRELAEKLHVTDKAVSKWERDLACPDTAALPQLAALLGCSVEELLGAKTAARSGRKGISVLPELILTAIPLAMGVAVIVTAILGELDVRHGFAMLGLGLFCLALKDLRKN